MLLNGSPVRRIGGTELNILRKIKSVFSGKSQEQQELEYLLSHGMQLGENSTILSGFHIDSGWPWLISIGDNVTISSNVTILAHDASPNVVECGTKLGRVTIGNNVFIGIHTTILCNTRIGDNVVVGAGSLVTRDLPSNGVYAGVPAVKVASIEDFRKKNEQQKAQSPHFDDLHSWREWRDAPEKDKEYMKKCLEDGFGFV